MCYRLSVARDVLSDTYITVLHMYSVCGIVEVATKYIRNGELIQLLVCTYVVVHLRTLLD